MQGEVNTFRKKISGYFDTVQPRLLGKKSYGCLQGVSRLEDQLKLLC
jgi:hypothetical protein